MEEINANQYLFVPEQKGFRVEPEPRIWTLIVLRLSLCSVLMDDGTVMDGFVRPGDNNRI